MARPMPSQDRSEEDGPDRELRSDFLRGQMRHWMDQVVAAGRTRELFELEMWLRAFERFFRIKNQPLSEREAKHLALRNWSEELRLVDNVARRAVQLCTAILTEDHVNLTHFDKYVEGYLKKDDAVDPYVEKLLRQASPEAGLTLLRDALEDLHVLLTDLVRLSRIPYATFTAVGRILYREIRRSYLLALVIDRKFKPIHDRITNPAVSAIIRSIPEAAARRQAAKIFLELFRLLHYLEFADPERVSEEDLKNTVLVFALITSETRLLLAYIERRVLRNVHPESRLHEIYDSLVYSLPFEMKKVISTELVDISVARQPDIVRARVENSHGILKDCFQQSLVQLAQVFDPLVQGRDIFEDFTAKFEQSVELREQLARLVHVVREFQAHRDDLTAGEMKEAISRFYDTDMKYLMYRDWSGFELFFIEILKCPSLSALLQISHRFDTFLSTLHREVQKRSILQNTGLGSDDEPTDEVLVPEG
jgi:hypothetical protein